MSAAPLPILKVAVGINGNSHLYKLTQSLSLDQIIQDICLENKHSYKEGQYALQLELSGSKCWKYINESNRGEVKDGSYLELVSSPSEKAKNIIQKIKAYGELSGEVTSSLHSLREVSSDSSFVREFLLKDGLLVIFDLILDTKLPTLEMNCCLTTLSNLMEHLNTSLIDPVIERIVKFVLEVKAPGPETIALSLSILCQIVSLGVHGSMYIAQKVGIEELTPHIWNQDATTVQKNALALINTMAKAKNKKIHNSMVTKLMKDTINTYILKDNVPDNDMAKELFEYQSLALSFKERKLNTPIDPLGRDFESIQELNGITVENSGNKTRNSIGSLLDENMLVSDALIKASSIQDVTLPVKKGKSFNLMKSSSIQNFTDDQLQVYRSEAHIPRAVTMDLSSTTVPKEISRLTLECMLFFARKYPKPYLRMFLAEEASWQPFPATCERLIKLIADIMGIRKSKNLCVKKYQPLFFNELAFVEELFCRMFLQLGRTRQDMKARTRSDQEKVIAVLQRQLSESLSKQPITLKDLAKQLRFFNYAAIAEIWKNEWREKEDWKIAHSPPILELKDNRREEILELVRKQRINVILKGSSFPKPGFKNQKTKKRNIVVALAPNHKSFLYYDTDEDGRIIPDTSGKMSLIDGASLVTGKKCPHILRESKMNNKSEYEFAFSIILDYEPNSSLDFTAPDQQTFDYWTDAINAVLGKDMKSKLMEADVEKLLDMEIRLQLLDIKDSDIPNDPPPIPPSPDNFNFVFTNV